MHVRSGAISSIKNKPYKGVTQQVLNAAVLPATKNYFFITRCVVDLPSTLTCKR